MPKQNRKISKINKTRKITKMKAVNNVKYVLSNLGIIYNLNNYEPDGIQTLKDFRRYNDYELKYLSFEQSEDKVLNWYDGYLRRQLNNFKFCVCLDDIGYTQKPIGDEILHINNRITSKIKLCSLEDFKDKVGNKGYPFCAGIFVNLDESNWIRRTKSNFCWQQVWALDFDKGITFEEFIHRATQYNIFPHFVYKTLSCDDEKLNKFRAVWIADFICTHTTVAESIGKLLMTIFPESDPRCKDASRIFFGGKGIIYKNPEGYLARLDILNLVSAVQRYIEDTNYKHRLEQIRAISEKTNICLNNGLLDVKLITLPIIKIFQLEKNKLDLENSSFFNGNCIDLSSDSYNQLVDKNVLVDEEAIYVLIRKDDCSCSKWYVLRMNWNKVRKIQNKVHTQKDKYKVKTNFEYSTQLEKQRGIKRENIEERCQLCSDLFQDKYLPFPELFGICTNLINIEGGLTLFQECLENSQHNIGRSTDWLVHSETINKEKLYPERCINFCPYASKCKHGKNILETVKTKRNKVVIVKKTQLITLEEGIKKLNKIVKEVFENE